MRPRAKSSLLWGVIGGLVFLVLAQGYRLFARLDIGIFAEVVLAVAVGAVATAATYAIERWLLRSERD